MRPILIPIPIPIVSIPDPFRSLCHKLRILQISFLVEVSIPGHLALMRSSRYEIIIDLSRIVIVILLYLAQDCAREHYLHLWPCGSTALLAQCGSCPAGPLPHWLRRAAATDGPLLHWFRRAAAADGPLCQQAMKADFRRGSRCKR